MVIVYFLKRYEMSLCVCVCVCVCVLCVSYFLFYGVSKSLTEHNRRVKNSESAVSETKKRPSQNVFDSKTRQRPSKSGLRPRPV